MSEEKCRKYLLQEFLDYFQSMRGSSSTTTSFLKVLLTSRPYPTIQQKLKAGPTIRLKTEDAEGNTNKDISSFITQAIDELADECGYDLTMKERVQERLISGADASFLWVSFVPNLFYRYSF